MTTDSILPHLVDAGNEEEEAVSVKLAAESPEVRPAHIASKLWCAYKFAWADNTLWRYDKDAGVYRPDGADFAKEYAATCRGHRATIHFCNEVSNLLKLEIQRRVRKKPPNSSGLVNVRNGLLDPFTGELSEHTPSVFTTVQLPVDWDPKAFDPEVDRFLQEVLPDSQVRETWLEACGYALLPDCRFQVGFILYGPGTNGKSTLLHLLRAVLGDEAVSSLSLQSLCNERFAAANLVGKLANIYPDLPYGELRETDRFKAMVCGEAITVERKFEQPFAYRNRAKFYFSTNRLPSAPSDTTKAFFRRFIVFPMVVDLSNTEDRSLPQRLTTEQGRSYFLRLMVEGLQRLAKRGHFIEPEPSKALKTTWRRQSSPVDAFLEECCVVSPGVEAEKNEVYEAYVQWCEANEFKALKDNSFWLRVKSRVPGYRERRPDGSSPRRAVGIALRDAQAV